MKDIVDTTLANEHYADSQKEITFTIRIDHRCGLWVVYTNEALAHSAKMLVYGEKRATAGCKH